MGCNCRKGGGVSVTSTTAAEKHVLTMDGGHTSEHATRLAAEAARVRQGGKGTIETVTTR